MGTRADYSLHNLDTVKATELHQIHRDLIAHEGRWDFASRWIAGEYRPVARKYTHLAKFFTGKHMNGSLVDLGCGPVIAMARMLYTNRRHVSHYIAVDFREPKLFKVHFPMEAVVGDVTKTETYDKIREKLEAGGQGSAPSYITTFEVLEHMPKADGQAFLDRIYELAAPDTTIFLSTPCHDGKHMPAEHIYEWGHGELKAELETRFAIEANYGTFASQKEILPVLNPAELETFYALADYYDSHYLATIFAPAHPAESRNSLWILRKIE